MQPQHTSEKKPSSPSPLSQPVPEPLPAKLERIKREQDVHAFLVQRDCGSSFYSRVGRREEVLRAALQVLLRDVPTEPGDPWAHPALARVKLQQTTIYVGHGRERLAPRQITPPIRALHGRVESEASMSRELTNDQQRVLAFVKRDPGATSRDVAREVFRGTGDTRTFERGKAHRVLVQLELMGLVKRKQDGDYHRGRAARWSAQ